MPPSALSSVSCEIPFSIASTRNEFIQLEKFASSADALGDNKASPMIPARPMKAMIIKCRTQNDIFVAVAIMIKHPRTACLQIFTK